MKGRQKWEAQSNFSEYHAKQPGQEYETKQDMVKMDEAVPDRLVLPSSKAELMNKKLWKDGRRLEQYEESEDVDGSRPTIMKVHSRLLSGQTLDFYDLPWGWDTVSQIAFILWLDEYA